MSSDPNYPYLFTPSVSTKTDLSKESSNVKFKQERAEYLQNPVTLFDYSFKDNQFINLAKLQETSQSMTLLENLENSDIDDSLSNQAFINQNRKEKSLGELSKKFLTMFGKMEDCIISLESVTNHLGVERRRIYDIINILESLGVILRKGKNHYQWKGLKSVHTTISQLQKENQVKSGAKSLQEEAIQTHTDEDFWDIKPMLRKEKYLSFLSTGFIKLFISWRNVISLEQAAKKLTSTSTKDKKLKTKVRRLYDIANVFCVLGIIKKTCLESKKPAFEWVGLSGFTNFIKKLHDAKEEKVQPLQINEKKNEEKTFWKNEYRGFVPKLAKLDEDEFRKTKEIPVIENILENFLTMLLQLCRQEIENPKNISLERFKPTPNSSNLENLKSNQRDLASVKDDRMNMLQRYVIEERIKNESKNERLKEFCLSNGILKDRTNIENTFSKFKRPAFTVLSQEHELINHYEENKHLESKSSNI